MVVDIGDKLGHSRQKLFLEIVWRLSSTRFVGSLSQSRATQNGRELDH
ncbi:hypothetical protein LF1_08840 [Rubripirellula obstinata]|uniref:Uncharacterized protein n=1 Tax=Rubripirellula obstinata TaxID=406547 RepID=A0A5B1CER4_9BACT|nr:hypothetical protein LF1_08840 [Rubripirellula obstinata]